MSNHKGNLKKRPAAKNPAQHVSLKDDPELDDEELDQGIISLPKHPPTTPRRKKPSSTLSPGWSLTKKGYIRDPCHDSNGHKTTKSKARRADSFDLVSQSPGAIGSEAADEDEVTKKRKKAADAQGMVTPPRRKVGVFGFDARQWGKGNTSPAKGKPWRHI